LGAGAADIALQLWGVVTIEAFRAELGENKVRFRRVEPALAVRTVVVALRNANMMKDGLAGPAPGAIGFESYVLAAN
jgi:hypothetical protein